MNTKTRSTTKIWELALITAAIALITFLHYFPIYPGFMSPITYMILLRRLYYIPILYAAIRFGLRGGLAASIATTVVFVPHAAQSMGGFTGPTAVDNLFDTILYNVVGVTTGLVVDARRRQSHRYQEVVKLNQEVKNREAAIRQIQAYTEGILSSISSGVISTDRSGNIITANPAARKLLSLGPESVTTSSFSQIFREHDVLLKALHHILEDKQSRVMTEIRIELDGHSRTLAVRMSPHRSDANTVGAVATFEDLTEVCNLTEQLIRADKLTGLGELVAGVAHEVRNPLGVIRASVQMIDHENAADDTFTELFQIMLQEIDRIDAVVNALLDFGRPSESQFELVEPRRVIEEVVLLSNQFAKQQSVDIKTGDLDWLPNIWADEDRLKQVFINLISNAIQAMPEGGRLNIGAVSQEGYLRINFADTGAGISPAEQKCIFDPFYTTRAKGSGLGLSIVHRIVDAHNGFITVNSESGQGSNFIVGLPLNREDGTHDNTANTSSKQEAGRDEKKQVFHR